MRSAMRTAVRRAITVGLLIGLPALAPAQQSSDETWNPFKWGFEAPRKKQAAPASGVEVAPKDMWQSGPRNRPIESTDLPPVLASDTSGLPLDLWRGLDLGALEKLLAAIEVPPRSPRLHQLWRRALLSSATPPAGARSSDDFLVLRQEALYRSGLLSDMAEMLDRIGQSGGPFVQVLRARVDLATDAARCRNMRVLPAGSGLPVRLRGEAQMLSGYCAAVVGDAAAARLAASIAREEGVAADLALTLLSSLESKPAQRLTLPARVSLIDYRLLELMGPVDATEIVDKAEAALLVVLAGSPAADVRLQTAAAEAALRLNALTPEAVADVYRRQPQTAARAAPENHEQADPLHRARLFRALEAAYAPEVKARLLRALLEDARRAGIHLQTARMMAPLVAPLWPLPESGVLAEPIVEVALAAGDFGLARRWAETAASLQHWLALIDIAEPYRNGGHQSGLMHLDALAARGRLDADLLHRLATVLDALDINVPMGIWEAAGRTPQPASGYLPETGVLAELAQVSQRKEAGHTILHVMRALGGSGAEGAHILVLGDAVRALKRAGLEADARRLGLEALLAVWPRASGH